MKNAPQKFLTLYMPDFAANIVDRITDTEAGVATLTWLLSKCGEGTKRYASFLKIGKSAEEIDVFRQLKDQYPNQDFKFVGLTMYMEDCGAMSSQSGFEGQLDGVLKIKQQYPDQFLVFLGVDPRWKDSGTELRKTVEQKFNYRLSVSAGRSVFPFVGLKLYPSTGFYAFDKRLKETFEWAADNGVPIISHCNYMGGIYNNDTDYLKQHLNPVDSYTNLIYDKPAYQNQSSGIIKKIFGTADARNNIVTCSFFLEPESFRTLFEYFHKPSPPSQSYTDQWYEDYRRSLDTLTEYQRLPIKICLAHYGGDDQILENANPGNAATPIGINPKNWCGQIQDLMRSYDHVYTDISYALHNPGIHKPVISDLEDPVIGDRILFGTDFFLTEREMPEKTNVMRFQQIAQAHSMQRNEDFTAWDQIASLNPEKFLFSKYYNGQVI